MQGTLEENARIDLRDRIVSATLSVRMAQLRLLLDLKAFRPDQPRIPRDYRYGGRWVGPDDDSVRRSEAECGSRCATFSPAPIRKTSNAFRSNSRFAQGSVRRWH
jgi:hypothetical protein